jgi:hypothetical protein
MPAEIQDKQDTGYSPEPMRHSKKEPLLNQFQSGIRT